MELHFTALPKTLPGLDPLEGGGVKFPFANLMPVHRPLMIVEFTATPQLNSNILHSATAQGLKLEEMIKLSECAFWHIRSLVPATSGRPFRGYPVTPG